MCGWLSKYLDCCVTRSHICNKGDDYVLRILLMNLYIRTELLVSQFFLYIFSNIYKHLLISHNMNNSKIDLCINLLIN